MKASGGGFSDIEGKQLVYPMEYDRCDKTGRDVVIVSSMATRLFLLMSGSLLLSLLVEVIYCVPKTKNQ